jgi:hypothetical protein
MMHVEPLSLLRLRGGPRQPPARSRGLGIRESPVGD